MQLIIHFNMLQEAKLCTGNDKKSSGSSNLLLRTTRYSFYRPLDPKPQRGGHIMAQKAADPHLAISSVPRVIPYQYINLAVWYLLHTLHNLLFFC
jgi:hypothetical protein